MSKILLHPLPARIFHWANILIVVVLMVTGFFIHDPRWFRFLGSMDQARQMHFIAMYLLLCGLIYRSGYSLISGDIQDLMFRPKDIKGFWSLVRYYLFLTDDLAQEQKYNSGQKLVYSLWPVLVILQGLTGLILYWPKALVAWALFLGGELQVRTMHYYVTWIFLCSVILHVYLAMLNGFEMVKSMIFGYSPNDQH